MHVQVLSNQNGARVRSKQLLYFVHGQGQENKKMQQVTLFSFITISHIEIVQGTEANFNLS